MSFGWNSVNWLTIDFDFLYTVFWLIILIGKITLFLVVVIDYNMYNDVCE